MLLNFIINCCATQPKTGSAQVLLIKHVDYNILDLNEYVIEKYATKILPVLLQRDKSIDFAAKLEVSGLEQEYQTFRYKEDIFVAKGAEIFINMWNHCISSKLSHIYIKQFKEYLKYQVKQNPGVIVLEYKNRRPLPNFDAEVLLPKTEEKGMQPQSIDTQGTRKSRGKGKKSKKLLPLKMNNGIETTTADPAFTSRNTLLEDFYKSNFILDFLYIYYVRAVVKFFPLHNYKEFSGEMPVKIIDHVNEYDTLGYLESNFPDLNFTNFKCTTFNPGKSGSYTVESLQATVKLTYDHIKKQACRNFIIVIDVGVLSERDYRQAIKGDYFDYETLNETYYTKNAQFFHDCRELTKHYNGKIVLISRINDTNVDEFYARERKKISSMNIRIDIEVLKDMYNRHTAAMYEYFARLTYEKVLLKQSIETKNVDQVNKMFV